MATVYKARQVSLDRTVAIKVLPKQFSNNPQFVERFYYEGRAAAKLNHPNIVGAYDVSKAGEFHYFVMEFVEGKTVFDDLQKIRRYKEADALRVMIQIARALDHAHKAGFMHRDVKPKNIMITPEGVAKLADMGLARAVSDREAAEEEKGKAFGTPYYISPEQIRGDEDVDSRADIYGFGATLYHMVTGRVPFDGPNPSAVMHKHLKEKLVPPDHINSELSSGIAEVIETCLAKKREDRYMSSEALLQDLEAIARGEAPLQARRKFDVGNLSGLENNHAHAPVQFGETRDAEKHRLIIIAVLGWATATILLLLLVVVWMIK
jgi:serine/threonine-protein kinase